jgi:alcohol dehydrogenase (cytochrome c)
VSTTVGSAKPSVSFTSAQAKDGAGIYAENCAECHGVGLKGISGPKLTGAAFRKKFRSARKLYEFISKQMPLSDPGSLSKKQYIDVTAFLLAKNGYRPGKKPLTESGG